MNTGKFNGPERINVNMYTKTRPNAPPMRQSNAASIRNSNRMVDFWRQWLFQTDYRRTFLYRYKHDVGYAKHSYDQADAPDDRANNIDGNKDSEMALLNASTLLSENYLLP